MDACSFFFLFFFFKQKTAYEMRISDWSSDVCSSDLSDDRQHAQLSQSRRRAEGNRCGRLQGGRPGAQQPAGCLGQVSVAERPDLPHAQRSSIWAVAPRRPQQVRSQRSEEHTSELQSLMRISYAVFCLKQKKKNNKE